MARSAESVADGRSARRHRNRDAVLDAVHELFVEGQVVPTTEAVAARSGVSLRSIYRYFPDRQELLRSALARRARVAEPLFVLRGIGEGTLTERIDGFVEHRLGLYELIAPTARAALSGRVTTPGILAVIERRRDQALDQTKAQFALELEALPEPARGDTALAIDVLCQFESLELLRTGRQLSPEDTRRLLLASLRALLSTPPEG